MIIKDREILAFIACILLDNSHKNATSAVISTRVEVSGKLYLMPHFGRSEKVTFEQIKPLKSLSTLALGCDLTIKLFAYVAPLLVVFGSNNLLLLEILNPVPQAHGTGAQETCKSHKIRINTQVKLYKKIVNSVISRNAEILSNKGACTKYYAESKNNSLKCVSLESSTFTSRSLSLLSPRVS